VSFYSHSPLQPSLDRRRAGLTPSDTFYIVDTEPALEGVDVATNATTAITAFTRYTVAPTTVMSQSTRITGHTAKSKHRPSKKRAAGRKGTVDEYEYLIGSLGRMVVRVDEKSGESSWWLDVRHQERDWR
jgi:elongator complex protein 1